MSLRRTLRQSVTVVRVSDSGVTDEYGNPTEAETARTSYGAWLEQTDSRELTVGRETQIADWLLVLPPEAQIDGTDRVEADGRVYEVIGAPDRVRTPRGEHHVEARLRLIQN